MNGTKRAFRKIDKGAHISQKDKGQENRRFNFFFFWSKGHSNLLGKKVQNIDMFAAKEASKNS